MCLVFQCVVSLSILLFSLKFVFLRKLLGRAQTLLFLGEIDCPEKTLSRAGGVDVLQPHTSVTLATSQATSTTVTTTTHASSLNTTSAISQAISTAQFDRQYRRKRNSVSEAAGKLELEDFRLSIQQNKLANEVLQLKHEKLQLEIANLKKKQSRGLKQKIPEFYEGFNL